MVRRCIMWDPVVSTVMMLLVMQFLLMDFLCSFLPHSDGHICRTEEDLNDMIALLSRACSQLNAEYVLLRSRSSDDEGYSSEYLIRQSAEIDDFHEVRVAVVGNVDAGKSTLLGVLTHGDLDNGRGLARQKLFRHKHELETGT